MTDRITVRSDVYHGQACVKGTRVPVFQIVRMLANGDTVESLLREYPTLEREDIMACLDYASFVVEQQKQPAVEDWERSLDVASTAW